MNYQCPRCPKQRNLFIVDYYSNEIKIKLFYLDEDETKVRICRECKNKQTER